MECDERIYWICPICKFDISAMMYLQIKYDLDCPHCKKAKLSEFILITKGELR